ncbi:hypothetical protein BOTNAR_0046g00280 [Botryotinia narcissicola]|uniref:Uncharacterized protein n=1 Tax=Botryotinia narcissicola TaxID=278944 RepID=A0A4Z1J0T1_9HELO|nr:hypothetical protein BOTNAR_0046g00280 [Botryotinia narcissicola]
MSRMQSTTTCPLPAGRACWQNPTIELRSSTPGLNSNLVDIDYDLSDFAPDQTHWNTKSEGVPRFIANPETVQC